MPGTRGRDDERDTGLSDIQQEFGGCAGCLLFILAALLIDALALVAIVNLIRAAFGL